MARKTRAAEPVEVEIVTDEEESEPSRPVKKPPRKGAGKKIVAIAVAVVLVAVALSAILLMSAAPQARIDAPGVDLTNVPAGKPVSFNGGRSASNQLSGSRTITQYSWDFGDGQKASGQKVTHTFLKKGDYTVRLTVTDNAGATASASMAVVVVGVVVTIPMAKLGDAITYDIVGSVDISNPNGYWTYTYTSHPTPFTTVDVTAEVIQAHIDIDRTQNPEMTVTTGQAQADDGFSEMHSTVDRKTTQTMPLTGWALVKLLPKTGLPQTVNQTIAGNGHAEEHAFSDLNTNSTVKTTRNDNYNIGLGTGREGSFTKTGSDTSIAHPKKREEFNVDALRSNRTFRTGDSGTQVFGSTTLEWSVVGEDSIKGIAVLQIHITMDDRSLASNGLSQFELNVWVSGVFSMPLKMTLHTEGNQNGNSVILDYSSTYKSFTPGDTAIPFGTCTASTSDGHFHARLPMVDYASPDTYSPAMGGDSPSLSTYPLPNAIDYAKANSQGLKSFLATNPGAFLYDGFYNETGGTPEWSLTFGLMNSVSGYRVVVTQSMVRSQGAVTVSQVTNSIKDYTSALTFTGAEQVFQKHDDIKNVVYSGNRINLNTYSFGSKADVPVPRPGIPINTNIISDATEYYFYVQAADGSFSAGVDSGTGQVLYINTHTGN